MASRPRHAARFACALRKAQSCCDCGARFSEVTHRARMTPDVLMMPPPGHTDRAFVAPQASQTQASSTVPAARTPHRCCRHRQERGQQRQAHRRQAEGVAACTLHGLFLLHSPYFPRTGTRRAVAISMATPQRTTCSSRPTPATENDGFLLTICGCAQAAQKHHRSMCEIGGEHQL